MYDLGSNFSRASPLAGEPGLDEVFERCIVLEERDRLVRKMQHADTHRSLSHNRLSSTLTVPHLVSVNAIVGHCGIDEWSRQYPGLALMRPVAPDESGQLLHEHHGNCHHNRHEHDHNCKMQGPADHMSKQGKARALRY
jgi:hypothetical protein